MCSVPYERRTDMCDEDMIYDCPCTVDCPRHRHCVSCIDHHRKLGWPLVACMQKMLKEHKAQKAAQKFGSRIKGRRKHKSLLIDGLFLRFNYK